MTNYYIQHNIGCAKYVLNYFDGIKKHHDGSNFYDIFIFKSKKALNTKLKELNHEIS